MSEKNLVYFTGNGSTFGPYKSELAATRAAKKIARERNLAGEVFRYQVSGAGQRMRDLPVDDKIKTVYSSSSRGEDGLGVKTALDNIARRQLQQRQLITMSGSFPCSVCGDIITHLYQDITDDAPYCPECGAEPTAKDLRLFVESGMIPVIES